MSSDDEINIKKAFSVVNDIVSISKQPNISYFINNEISDKKTQYITSPIFYANSDPHIGHIYTGLVCDLWKKFFFVFDKQLVFTSGMDEHGQKVMQSAQKQGISTQEYVEKMNDSFKSCFFANKIDYSNWIRTTDKKHEEAVKDFWLKLQENGYIYKNKYSGWYSITDEHYIEGDKDSIQESDKIVWREEECYYFKLSAFQDSLTKFYEENKNIIYPEIRYNETIGLLKQGLKDFSISRPKERLSWGIEVPNDQTQVIYVWIDALVSYLSSIGYPNINYQELWPAIHVIGKDILRFHSIYWPALLMAANIPIFRQLIVHGWWLNGDFKISKSLNNAIDIKYYIENYGNDALRYYLLSNMSLGADSSFKDELFRQDIESILSNKFGNLLTRVIGLAKAKKIEKLIPLVEEGEVLLDRELSVFIKEMNLFTSKFLSNLKYLDEYTVLFVKLVDILNIYIDSNEIWKINKENLNDVLYGLLYCLKLFSAFFYPLLPKAMEEVLNYFDTEINYEKALIHKEIFIKDNLILFPRKNLSV